MLENILHDTRKYRWSFLLTMFFRHAKGCVKSRWGCGNDSLDEIFLICSGSQKDLSLYPTNIEGIFTTDFSFVFSFLTV